MKITKRLGSGKWAFGAVVAITTAVTAGGALISRVGSFSTPPSQPPLVIEPVTPPIVVGPDTPAGTVIVRGKVSQTKVPRNGAGELFVDVEIESPADREVQGRRRPTDMILILDRSGSMADQNRLAFAKAAIRELARSLGAEDRLALVSFDDQARIELAPTEMNGPGRERVLSIVNGIETGGSTNISDGFDGARAFLGRRDSARATRVLLLSDGEANAGVTDLRGLSEIVKGFVAQGAVVSTIGMGLGFNQSLMSALADHGMGNYSYLESLESLSQILRKDLQDSRSLYAATSTLSIRLGDGVTVTDAGGYPIEQGGSVVRVPTGQLLAGSRKSFMLTLRVPTDRPRDVELGKLGFSYERSGQTLSARVQSDLARVTVTEDAQEVTASIRQDVYRKGWVANNMGKLRGAIGSALASNDAVAAQEKLKEYKAGLADAEGYGGGGLTEAAGPEMKALEADVGQAFAPGSASSPELRNRLAKKQHSAARAMQRSN